MTLEPVAGGVEQRFGNLRVVNAFKKTEKANAVVISLQMTIINNSGNSPNGFAAFIGDERLNLVVQTKSGLFESKKTSSVIQQWRNPVRVPRINLFRKGKKFIFLL